MTATLLARGLAAGHGARTLFSGLDLVVAPGDVIGLVGVNGAGKSTLLRLLAGLDTPQDGTVRRSPADAGVGYLPQEVERRTGETVLEYVHRRTGVADAQRALDAAAEALAAGPNNHAPDNHAPDNHQANDYPAALDHWLALGAADLDERIGGVLDDLGLRIGPNNPMMSLSGGQAARVGLAALLLSRFDVLLLDEPTNDLDLDGLARLERFVHDQRSGLVLVSHDRDFLDRTVASVLELDEHRHTAREYGGGWAGYQAERVTARRHASEAFATYERRRTQLEGRAQQQREWATKGVAKETRSPRDNDRAQRGFRVDRTEKLASKARQADRALASLDAVDKPWEGWDLRFTIGEADRAGAVVARLSGAVVERGSFRLGPIDLQIDWGDRLGLTGANGTGKSTLVGAVLGTLPLRAGARWVGPSVVPGVLGQDRRALGGDRDLVREVCDRCGVTLSAARSLLAKFGLQAEQVTRPAGTLSPGERTRAELAVFQALGVNFLVLDEPTNHLDLPAIEQLEAALTRFTGTLLLVSHDRRLLEAVELTRTLDLGQGPPG